MELALIILAGMGLACLICLAPMAANAFAAAASCMAFQRALVQDKDIAYWAWGAIPAAWRILRRGAPAFSIRLKDGRGYGEWQHTGKWRIYRGNEIEVQHGEWAQ